VTEAEANEAGKYLKERPEGDLCFSEPDDGSTIFGEEFPDGVLPARYSRQIFLPGRKSARFYLDPQTRAELNAKLLGERVLELDAEVGKLKRRLKEAGRPDKDKDMAYAMMSSKCDNADAFLDAASALLGEWEAEAEECMRDGDVVIGHDCISTLVSITRAAKCHDRYPRRRNRDEPDGAWLEYLRTHGNDADAS